MTTVKLLRTGLLKNCRLRTNTLNCFHTSARRCVAVDFKDSNFKKTNLILSRYDAGYYENSDNEGEIIHKLTGDEVLGIVETLKAELKEAGDNNELFGCRHSDAIFGIVNNIEQTFGGSPLYPTVASRASQLVYSMVKSHPFIDGNKRTAAATLLHYLQHNKYAVDADGVCTLKGAELANLIINIAESNDESKDATIRSIHRHLKTHL